MNVKRSIRLPHLLRPAIISSGSSRNWYLSASRRAILNTRPSIRTCLPQTGIKDNLLYSRVAVCGNEHAALSLDRIVNLVRVLDASKGIDSLLARLERLDAGCECIGKCACVHA